MAPSPRPPTNPSRARKPSNHQRGRARTPGPPSAACRTPKNSERTGSTDDAARRCRHAPTRTQARHRFSLLATASDRHARAGRSAAKRGCPGPSPATQENVETQLQVLPDLREREVHSLARRAIRSVAIETPSSLGTRAITPMRSIPDACERHCARCVTGSSQVRSERHRELPRGWRRQRSSQGRIGCEHSAARSGVLSGLLLLRLTRASRSLARCRHRRTSATPSMPRPSNEYCSVRTRSTGKQLVTAAGSAARAKHHPKGLPPGDPAELVTLTAAAEAIGVDVSYLRRLARESATSRSRRTHLPVADRATSRSSGRTTHLDAEKVGGQWMVTRAEVERFIEARNQPQVVMAYDITFSAPKSLSIVWATGDEATRRLCEDAFEAGVARGVAYLEDARAVRRPPAGPASSHEHDRCFVPTLDEPGTRAAAPRARRHRKHGHRLERQGPSARQPGNSSPTPQQPAISPRPRCSTTATGSGSRGPTPTEASPTSSVCPTRPSEPCRPVENRS